MVAAFVPAAAVAVSGARTAPVCGRAARRGVAAPAYVVVPAPARGRACRMGVDAPLASAAADAVAAAASAAAAAAAAAPGTSLDAVAATPTPLAISWSALHTLTADVGSTVGGMDVQALGLVAAIVAGALLAAVVAFVIIKV